MINPRPRLEFSFAPRTRAATLAREAALFFPAVLGLSANQVLWTDESCLSDFKTAEGTGPLLARIEAVYGVSVADVSPSYLVSILERLSLITPKDLGPPPWADQFA